MTFSTDLGLNQLYIKFNEMKITFDFIRRQRLYQVLLIEVDCGKDLQHTHWFATYHTNKTLRTWHKIAPLALAQGSNTY